MKPTIAQIKEKTAKMEALLQQVFELDQEMANSLVSHTAEMPDAELDAVIEAVHEESYTSCFLKDLRESRKAAKEEAHTLNDDLDDDVSKYPW